MRLVTLNQLAAMQIRFTAAFFVLLFASCSAANAGFFDEDLQRHYDLVAVVTIDSKSDEYEAAYNATVERVILRYGEGTQTADSYQSTEVDVGDKLMIVRYGIKKLEKIQSKTKRVDSIRQDGCRLSRTFPIGKRLRLYAIEIQPGFYKNNACRLTATLNENS